jgi:hypothetical protein
VSNIQHRDSTPWPTSSARIKTMLGFLVTGLSAELEGMSKRDNAMKKRALLSKDVDPSDGFIFSKDGRRAMQSRTTVERI